MAGIIPKNVLEDIRYNNDIADVIGSRIPLKKAGSAFKALCPFHKEKTPSFHVNPQKQIFHCFGCGEGGDVYAFIMRYEGVDFMTAARMLASQAGIRLEFDQAQESRRVDKDALYRLLDDLALFYHRTLTESDPGTGARDYLNARALHDDIIKNFLIGYAPHRRSMLQSWARKKGYGLKQLEAVGMLGKGDDADGAAYYERFRNRVMFPVRNESGRIVGFSGRILGEEKNTGKYINSPETVLFKKSRILYGLYQARQAIADRGQVILCEGQIDVIRCHQAGIHHAVAPQGTALTEEHTQLLKRYTDRAVLLFDADQAGQKAALRSAEVLLPSGMQVLAASLPEGEDPDSIILKKGVSSLLERIDQSKSLVDFLLDIFSRDLDTGEEAELMKAAQQALEIVRRIPSELQREQMLRRIQERLGLVLDSQERALRRELQHTSRNRYTLSQPEEEPSAEEAVRPPPEEFTLIEFMLQYEEVFQFAPEYVSEEDFTSHECRELFRQMKNSPSPLGHDVLRHIDVENQKCIQLLARAQSIQRKISSEDITPIHAAQELILVLRRMAFERKRKKLKIRLAHIAPEKKEELEMECKQLTVDIHALRQGWTRAAPILELSMEQQVAEPAS